MNKKKMLVLGPISPQPSDIKSIAGTLNFLQASYHIDYMDSLAITDSVANPAFYNLWRQELVDCSRQYDAFMGFSYGGVILQQCFSLFEGLNKPIVLLSTPSFADRSLNLTLGKVIKLCEAGQITEALDSLYQYVFLKPSSPFPVPTNLDGEKAAQRLISGLRRVLNTDSTDILNNSLVDHLHLIGENSRLVNRENVFEAQNSTLLNVPDAGMRVLEDNPYFCQQSIREFLSRDF